MRCLRLRGFAFGETGAESLFELHALRSSHQLVGQEDEARLVERVAVRFGMLPDDFRKLRIAKLF